MNSLSKVLVKEPLTIREAMKMLGDNAKQILLVVSEYGRLEGTITDGDIRRALLANMNLGGPVSRIVNKNPKVLYELEREKAVGFMKKHSILHVPILDNDGKVVDLVSWKDANNGAILKRYSKKDNIVFILAGGKGARLDPFTKILPKPLIPIHDKPIIEVVMENFLKYNFNNFIISLNYKGEMIKTYFKDNSQGLDIRYVEEKDFLGTAGSLRFIKKKAKKPVLVSNCDVILGVNFDEALEYHRNGKNDITIVGIMRHVKIPYGVMHMKNGKLLGMREKPEYDFLVNAGTYVVEPRIIGLIRKDEHIDMPDLIMRAKKAGYRVGVYPASSDWIDVGQWEEYRKALDHFYGAGVR